MRLTEAVKEELQNIGLAVDPLDDDSPAISVSFEVDDTRVVCFLVAPQDEVASGGYFFLFAPARPNLALDDCPAEVLRELIRASSNIPLAKLEYIEIAEDSQGHFFATSKCSVENYTAEKLRRRLEGCALLSLNVSKIFRQAAEAT